MLNEDVCMVDSFALMMTKYLHNLQQCLNLERQLSNQLPNMDQFDNRNLFGSVTMFHVYL